MPNRLFYAPTVRTSIVAIHLAATAGVAFAGAETILMTATPIPQVGVSGSPRETPIAATSN
jgi:hypothetical protein